jgi:hypothetical protein
MARQDKRVEALQAKIERDLDRIINVNYRFGAEFEKRLSYYLIQDPETGMLTWRANPPVFYEGSTPIVLPNASVDDFANATAEAWNELNAGLSEDLLASHKAGYLSLTAHLLNEKYIKDFIAKWENDRSEIYRQVDGLFKQHQYTDLKSLTVGDGYQKIAGNIIQGIADNDNPADVISRIRRQVFGLAEGERNAYLTFRANMLYRTEMKHAEKLINQEAIRSNPGVYGIRVRYYGGPCTSGICLAVLMGGHNFKQEGEEATAEFWVDKGGLYFPTYHPNCHCAVVEYLRAYDAARRGELAKSVGAMPDKVPAPFILDRAVPTFG